MTLRMAGSSGTGMSARRGGGREAEGHFGSGSGETGPFPGTNPEQKSRPDDSGPAFFESLVGTRGFEPRTP